MGKKFLFVLAFATLFSFSSEAQKIASVDINKILEGMSEYQTAQSELDKLAAKWRQEIAQEYDKIKGMYSRYQAEEVLLSDDMKRQKENEIMAKEKEVRELQRNKFGAEGSLFKKRQELVQPIQEMVYNAIEEFADKKGFDYIFDVGSGSGIIFSNDKYDKTKEISNLIAGE